MDPVGAVVHTFLHWFAFFSRRGKDWRGGGSQWKQNLPWNSFALWSRGKMISSGSRLLLWFAFLGIVTINCLFVVSCLADDVEQLAKDAAAVDEQRYACLFPLRMSIIETVQWLLHPGLPSALNAPGLFELVPLSFPRFIVQIWMIRKSFMKRVIGTWTGT